MGYSLHEHGVPVVDDSTCTGCGQCVAICPDQVLALDGGRPRPGKGLLLGCIACGHCMAVCPTQSITVSGRGARSDDRLELPPPDRRATAEQFAALAAARRSIRRFTPQAVPREVLDQIVETAATAPMGLPPSEVGVVVFPTAEFVQVFAEEACKSFSAAAAFLNPLVLALMRPFVGKVQYEGFRDFIRPLMKMLPEMRRGGRDLFTYDAPAAMLFHYGPASDPFDCAIVATYATLAAESHGLGSCMLGTSVALNQNRQVKEKYGIPRENKVSVALVLGYPAVGFQAGVRRRLATVKYVGAKERG
jgi:nitroreductase/NAD-dependent dihydropyrimidine dehydrogenase PreA subunit